MSLLTNELRTNHAALELVNRVRYRLGMWQINELPQPDEYYSETTCPIAIAIGGLDDTHVTIDGTVITTTDLKVVEAFQQELGIEARYLNGRYTFDSPSSVISFVTLFDLAWELEQNNAALTRKLGQVADITAQYRYNSDYSSL